MTDLRNGLLKALDKVEEVLSDDLGLRTHRVFLRSDTWTAAAGAHEQHKGARARNDVELTPRPYVKELGGQRLRVGPITPAYTVGLTSGGYTPQQLIPSDVNNIRYRFVVEGPDAVQREYIARELNTEDPLGYFVDLDPLDRAGTY